MMTRDTTEWWEKNTENLRPMKEGHAKIIEHMTTREKAEDNITTQNKDGKDGLQEKQPQQGGEEKRNTLLHLTASPLCKLQKQRTNST